MATADVVTDLATLVGFPTVSSRPNLALCAFVAERFEAMGFDIERFEDPEETGKATLICRAGPEGEDGLVLSGHTDVVPVEGQPWSSDPFSLQRRGDRLHARGAADMKGFLAAALAGLADLPLHQLRRQLVLVWTHDEEIGCQGSARLAEALLQRRARLPSACWIGEPTGMRILHQHAGHVAAEVRCHGQAAHSAYPHLGANAVHAAVRVAEAIASHQADFDAAAAAEPGAVLAGRVPLNLASLHGGDAINIVPDHATLRIGFRPPPGCSHLPLVAAFERAVQSASLPAGTRVESRVLRVTPSLRTPLGLPLQRALDPHTAHAGQGDEAAGTAGFATDGGNLQRLGCAPLIFGPGRIEVAHQADEYVELDQLHAAVSAIAAVTRSWTGVGAR